MNKDCGRRLASLPTIERTHVPDPQAMITALKLVLGLPVPPTALWLEDADGTEAQAGGDL
jgi:hypothetical protein